MRTPSERDLGRVKFWKEESFKSRRKKQRYRCAAKCAKKGYCFGHDSSHGRATSIMSVGHMYGVS
jgi:hypothetical protein